VFEQVLMRVPDYHCIFWMLLPIHVRNLLFHLDGSYINIRPLLAIAAESCI
jgi:hypothetical protein